MPTPRVLAFAGSARRDSFNAKLLKVAAQGVKDGGGELTLVEIRDFPMPLYDGDLEKEKGPPENAMKLRKLIGEHHGLLLACPEYNSSITPLLKNTIDWCSRNEKGQGDTSVYKGKVAGLVAASPGALGGLRGLVTVRSILGNIGVIVITQQFALVKAGEAFNDDGSMKDEKGATSAKAVAAEVARHAAKLTA